MKYLLILADGMADLPIEKLDGKTPLAYANTPNMDYLAKNGTLGLVKTVPDRMAPGSDIANLSVMGYAPHIYYTGRSPLEALNIGVSLEEHDVAIRTNFVTLSDETNYFDKTLIDYCADEITTAESNELIKSLNSILLSKVDSTLGNTYDPHQDSPLSNTNTSSQDSKIANSNIDSNQDSKFINTNDSIQDSTLINNNDSSQNAKLSNTNDSNQIFETVASDNTAHLSTNDSHTVFDQTFPVKRVDEFVDPTISKAYKDITFFTGTSYRHCMVWNNGKIGLGLTPPHDITGKKITDHLPKSPDAAILYELMQKSYDILSNHPINIKRIKEGKNPANSIWFWGEGKKPFLKLFKDKYGVDGSMISAVDLLKGIALCAGLDVINVDGATGNIHTNFSGKAKAAMDEFDKGKDFVFVHIEAPDECGHQGDLPNKIRAIELIDKEVLGYLLKSMEKFDDFRILLLPDHPTPISLKTHTSEPVPYVIFQKQKIIDSSFTRFDESTAALTNNFVEIGSDLMEMFISSPK